MKKLFLFLALLFSAAPLFSQNKISTGLFFTGGYNISSSTFDGLSFVTGRYNELRPALTKKLETPPYLKGYSAGIGLSYGRLFVEFLYQQKKSPVGTAENTVGGIREYKVQLDSYNIGTSFSFLKRGHFDFTLGASIDLVKLNQYTRSYTKGGSIPDFYDVDMRASGTTNTLYGFIFSRRHHLISLR